MSQPLPSFSPTYTAPQIMMTLAAIAYAPADEIAHYLANTSYATQGLWNVVWGPVVTPDTSANLVYVVQYKSDPIYAVVVRGTVLTFSLATLVDLYEDLDVGTQSNWEYPSVQDAQAANGTLYALGALTQLTWNDMTLLDFLSTHTAGGWLFVTGHSLGGCLTSVLAPWLQYQLSTQSQPFIGVPFTFAAPTAGNAAFANWYSETFSGRSWRYYNTIDMVPFVWENLSGITALFPSPGPSCPDLMQGLIDLVNAWLTDWDQVSYAQTNGPGNALPNEATAMSDWFSEVALQHNHNTYLTLLGAPTINIPSMVPSLQVKPRHRLPKRG
jgi:hypothetical protein